MGELQVPRCLRPAIEFTPRATEKNLGRLWQVLTDLDARIRTEGVHEELPFSHDAVSLTTLACET